MKFCKLIICENDVKAEGKGAAAAGSAGKTIA